jgi:prophage regulatory protein
MFSETFLRDPIVGQITGLCRSRRYELAATGEFPKPIKLSQRACAWRQSEIEAWQRWRIAIAEGRAVEGSTWRYFLEAAPPPSPNAAQAQPSEPLPFHGSGTGVTRRRGRS